VCEGVCVYLRDRARAGTHGCVRVRVRTSEGVLIVFPLKMPASSLPFLVMRKILGIGHAGSYDSRRSTALGERMSIPG